MQILLTGLPMPPSSNNIYVTSRSGHRFPSLELKAFKKAMADWRLENLALVTTARRELVARFKSEQRFVRIDRYFVFPRDRVLNLDGTATRQDASNRIKGLDDSLANEVLGLDDCWFVSGWCEKVIAKPGSSPSVIVCLSRSEIRTEDDILEVGILGKTVPWAVDFQRQGP